MSALAAPELRAAHSGVPSSSSSTARSCLGFASAAGGAASDASPIDAIVLDARLLFLSFFALLCVFSASADLDERFSFFLPLFSFGDLEV